MHRRFWICLFAVASIHSWCEAQSDQVFDYLKKRAGVVDISLKTQSDDHTIVVSNIGQIILDPAGEKNMISITFENLRLGLDSETRIIKSKRDRENLYLSIPSSPEYMTQAGSGIQLSEITNNGRLAAAKSDKVNTSVTVTYDFENNSLDTIVSSISIRYMVDAYEDKTPIRSADKGGDLLKLDLMILPGRKALSTAQANKLFYRVVDSTLSSSEMVKLAQLYLAQYSRVDPDRTKVVGEIFSKQQEILESVRSEAKLFDEIESSFSNGLTEECYELCVNYEQKEKGRTEGASERLAQVLYYGVLSASDDQKSKRNSWLKKLQLFYPAFYQSKQLELQAALRSRKSERVSGRQVFQQSVPDSVPSNQESAFDTMLAEDLEFVVYNEDLSDEGHLIVDENQQELRVQTADLSETYIVKFVHNVTKRMVANPSFKGAEKRIDLAELDIENGPYEISLYNNSGQQLDTGEIMLASRKLSSELRYLLGVGLLLLTYLIYSRFFKL